MDYEKIKNILIGFISNIKNEKIEIENDDISFIEDLGLDSMEFVELIVMIRDQFNIKLPAGDYAQIQTLNGCILYLQSIKSR